MHISFLHDGTFVYYEHQTEPLLSNIQPIWNRASRLINIQLLSQIFILYLINVQREFLPNCCRCHVRVGPVFLYLILPQSSSLHDFFCSVKPSSGDDMPITMGSFEKRRESLQIEDKIAFLSLLLMKELEYHSKYTMFCTF